MITYLKGALTHKTPTAVVIEVQGVGYEVHISLNTYARIEQHERVKLLTHQHIKEDAHTLYGFADAGERRFFRLLISVSGVGPATAQIMLSSLTTDELQAAIVGEDVVTLRRVKGIGAKTAQRIILDLKDKVLKAGGTDAADVLPAANEMRQEALLALTGLGINRSQAQKVLNKVLRQSSPPDRVEELIRAALRELN